MSDTEKIHVPDGDPARTQKLYVFDAKARSCPDCHSIGPPQDGCEHPWHIMGIQPDDTLVHQFRLGGDLDWAGGLCELHCREDRCGDRGQRCQCPGHQEDGTHITQTTIHDGIHGWYAHDSFPLHQHNPVTKSIRWATAEETERIRQATQPYEDPRHDADGMLYVRRCTDEVLCVNRCGSGPCSRECQVCRRLAWSGESGPPCPACPDSKASQAADKQAREGRCPDRGYCHGSQLGVASTICAPGTCLRVHTSGPLSGVFPGDRWPDEVLAANGVITTEATPLRKAIAMAAEATRCLRVARDHDSPETIEAHLALAASLAQDAVKMAVRANRALTGKETIKYQGVEYTDQPSG